MFFATLGVLLAYMPTMALSNSVALNAITDTEQQFPAIRVFGTIGWIVAGLIVGLAAAGRRGAYADAALPRGRVSLVYGLYSFTLPNTLAAGGQGTPSLFSLLGP